MTRVVAVRTDAGIELRLYDGETLARTVPLTLEQPQPPRWGKDRWGEGTRLG
jgi:hypothetical protein